MSDRSKKNAWLNGSSLSRDPLRNNRWPAEAGQRASTSVELDRAAAMALPRAHVAHLKRATWSSTINGRGLIISPPMTIKSNNSFSGNGGVNPTRLRTWTLFWDRLDLPENALVGIGLCPDMELLEKEGILRRSIAQSSEGRLDADSILDAYLATFRAQDAAEPGAWAMATGPGALHLPDRELDEGRGLRVRLVDALAIPAGHAQLEGVLEFRNRRSSERRALMAHLEKLYQEIQLAPDKPLAEFRAFDELDRALADHLRVAKGSGLPFQMSPLEVSLNAGNLAGAITTGVASHGTFGLPLVGAALAGLAVQALGSVGISASLKGKTDSSPFSYVSAYRDDLPYISQ